MSELVLVCKGAGGRIFEFVREGYGSRHLRTGEYVCMCTCVRSCAHGRCCALAGIGTGPRVFVRGCRCVCPGVWFVCVLCVCVQMPLSSPGAPSVTGPPPALPGSRPPRDLNPATHRGGGFGSRSSPGPTHLGPVATPL